MPNRRNIYNPGPLRRMLQYAKSTGRVDIACGGDSNICNYNHGFNTGVARALEALGIRQYATCTNPVASRKNTTGADTRGSIGPGESSSVGSGSFQITGATAYDAFFPAADLATLAYLHLPFPTLVTVGANFLILNPKNEAIGVTQDLSGPGLLGNKQIKAHFWHGRFTSNGGTFPLRIRNGGATLASSFAISSAGTDGDVQHVTLGPFDLVDENTDLEFQLGVNAANDVEGNFVGLAMRFEDTSRRKGYSIHRWGQKGGSTSVNMLDASTGSITKQSDAFFEFWFDRLCELQTSDLTEQRLIFLLYFGINDRGVSTKAQFKQAHIDFIEKVVPLWVNSGRLRENLCLWLMPGHPHPTPSNEEDFYEASREVCRLYNDIATAVDLKGVALTAEYTSNSWYDPLSSAAHLSLDGYKETMDEVLAEVLADPTQAKPVPSALTALSLNGAKQFAALWKIVRKDGRRFFFTSHDQKIEFEGDTYLPAGGIEQTAREVEAGLKDTSMDVRGAITSDSITHEDLRKGLWNDAKITEITIDPRIPLFGAYMRNSFWIREVQYDGERWDAEISGQTPWLRQKIGFEYNRVCRHTLGVQDANGIGCGYDLEANSVSMSVTSVQDTTLKFTTGLLTSAGDSDLYTEGVVEWLTGNNTGVLSEVKVQTDNAGDVQLELYEQTPGVIQTGDTAILRPGCNKTVDNCKRIFNQLVNFGGFNLIPGNDRMVLTPDSR